MAISSIKFQNVRTPKYTAEFVTLQKGDRHEWNGYVSIDAGCLYLEVRPSGIISWYEFNANDPEWMRLLKHHAKSEHFKVME